MALLSPAHAQDASHNYVKTTTMLSSDGSKSMSAVQYYNGLGYPTVGISSVGTSGQTAGILTTYDGLGREKRKYVPVPGNGLEHMTESNFFSKAYYYMDSSGYTQNHYDALGRVTAVDIAGDKWKSAGKQNSTEYLANTSDDKVFHYEAPVGDSNSLTSPESTSYTYYPAGTLTKVVSRDAERKSVTVFTDFFGNKILERTAAGDTYYVYNNLGQLRFVLSPEYKNNSANKAIYSYEYRYNNKGRLIEKILPGGDGDGVSVKYWYDNADRVAFAQDAALGGRYRFCLYDKFGRLCVQGTCSNCYQNPQMLSTTSYNSSSDGICKTGYTSPYTISNAQLEIVNYYDNYDFMDKNQKGIMPTVTVTAAQKKYSVGSLTGSVVYATNGSALGSVNVYDYRGQVVRAVRKGLDNMVEDVTTAYNITGAVDNSEAKVNIGYGGNFIAKTVNTYRYGSRSNMSLSVSHGNSAITRTIDYDYNFTGKLSRKDRQIGRSKSSCSYTYDVHGWLTSISSGGFTEQLYYADGLNDEFYNGNISTIKWKTAGDISCQGYNLEYDENNRLTCATFGSGDNLTSNKGYFNESAKYDNNGNIINLKRGGLVNKMYGGFGLVDNLTMTYDGNRLMSVRDDASRHTYTGATDFDGVKGQEYPLTYNEAGALVSDAGRRIARIDYDAFCNPIRIQFTNGNVTKYIYSATGEKLRVVYQTAVPNLSVPIGETRELSPSEILNTNYTDYLLGGSLTLNNGRIDKYYFEEGYCQAEANYQNDYFTFYYFNQDHLGNIRQVIEATGSAKVIQNMNDYPFGAEFCDGSTKNYNQKRKYNGKEFDNMHGLNTYDYGARQYNPVTARWDRMDPLAEKYSGVSPYVYCNNNPVNAIDPDGLLTIFINGNHFGKGGASLYWEGVDKQIMNTTLDFHAFYYDGALGGKFNLESMSCENRIQSGFAKGYSEAARIIDAAGDESLKFITHSMGGAYGNGFIRGLQQYASDNNKTLPMIEYILDIAPFQGGDIDVIPNLIDKTIELSHSDDYIAGGKEKGIKNFHESSSGNWINPSNCFGHGISTFKKDIMQWLPESKTHSFSNTIWEEKYDKYQNLNECRKP